jgi:hypothetical protein
MTLTQIRAKRTVSVYAFQASAGISMTLLAPQAA